MEENGPYPTSGEVGEISAHRQPLQREREKAIEGRDELVIPTYNDDQESQRNEHQHSEGSGHHLWRTFLWDSEQVLEGEGKDV